MKNTNALLFSQSAETRLYVLEHTVHLEEFLSMTLGQLLNIEWQNSKSLGFSSTSLTFSQKTLLVQDIQDVPAEVKKDLITVMQIRNKFAHVKAVKSFENFSNYSDDTSKLMKNLIERYMDDNIEENIEDKYKYCFYRMVGDLFVFFTELNMAHISKTIRQEVINEKNQKFIDLLKEEVSNSPEASEVWSKAFEKLEKITTDKT